MKICMVIKDKLTGEVLSGDDLMRSVNLDPCMRFEAIAVQDDGTPIICDNCGNFGYVDTNKYDFCILSDY